MYNWKNIYWLLTQRHKIQLLKHIKINSLFVGNFLLFLISSLGHKVLGHSEFRPIYSEFTRPKICWLFVDIVRCTFFLPITNSFSITLWFFFKWFSTCSFSENLYCFHFHFPLLTTKLVFFFVSPHEIYVNKCTFYSSNCWHRWHMIKISLTHNQLSSLAQIL